MRREAFATYCELGFIRTCEFFDKFSDKLFVCLPCKILIKTCEFLDNFSDKMFTCLPCKSLTKILIRTCEVQNLISICEVHANFIRDVHAFALKDSYTKCCQKIVIF